MNELFRAVAEASGRDSLLAALLVIVAALFVVTLAFSVYAVALRLRNEARDRRRERYAAKWRDRLLVALVDENEAAALRDSIQEHERVHFVGFAVQYARRMRGEDREALAGLVKPFLEPIVARAGSPRVETRARAIQTLGMLGLPAHAPRVIAALDDRSPLVAMVAARCLSLVESPEYAEAVLARLHRFSGWNRRFLASMLAAMGPGVAVSLRTGLGDTRAEPRSRAVLAEALEIQGDLGAGDVAAATLETATDPELIGSALRLLEDVGRPEHVEAVRAHARSQDIAVRAQALQTLGAVGGESDIPQLVASMRDASPMAALSAARGVRAAGGARVLSDLAASGDEIGVIARQVLAGETR
jgi:HEAT repeat protein